MSYDLNIWSVNPVRFPDSLPVIGNWSFVDDQAYYDGGSWLIAIGASQRVENDDIPEQVVPLLAGVQHLTELNLEPIDAPERARQALRRIAKHVAKQERGVIEDPQAETFTTPAGVTRYAPPARKDERFSLLAMSWRFLNGYRKHAEFWPWLVDYFKRNLPEALPRRYGLWEPPQFRFNETGEGPLLQFLEENKYDTIVWYPQRPVASIHLGLVPHHWVKGKLSIHFVPNRLELEIESDVPSQPGWVTQLRRVWRDISNYVRPFYGDVRVLHGFYRGRATYFLGWDTEEHPVRVPWNGIPRTLGMALVVGEPYTRLWPGIAEFGEEVDGLRFVDGEDWESGHELTEVVGPVPQDIVHKYIGDWFYTPNYPPVFPFKEPANLGDDE